MASNSGPRGLVTMVCITCGAEQFFDTAVPSSITCQKCGSTVFRQFATPTEPDEATISQLEEQARSIQYGDSSPQTSPDEVRELGNR
jgi:DNA-directed RNA polymerase subunit RPC12/RpoP